MAFGPDGGVWRLLRDDPDRYIYPAVGHGIAWNARQPEDPKRLDAAFDLPDDIAAGIGDVSRRGGWNATALDDHALPTETWREVVARRQRYAEVRAKLAAGEVQEINDLITLNLDIERFARDVIAQSEGPELLRAFWHALYGNQERCDTGMLSVGPHVRLRRVPLRRPQHFGAALHRLPRGDARVSWTTSVILANAGIAALSHLGRTFSRLPRASWTSTLARNKETSTASEPLLHPKVHRPEQPLRRGH